MMVREFEEKCIENGGVFLNPICFVTKEEII